ncbi:hypothetical protein B0H14DRAFT_2603487 [Mycena olivaceomarginata]|nr:hypothetical protein B0H14DRAFT_2603487 [Mycena olivaceomarginata]
MPLLDEFNAPTPSTAVDMVLDNNERLLPVLRVSDFTTFSEDGEYEFGPRILIGLKDYVFDVTILRDSLGSGGRFSTYAFKDISYALTKFSTLNEDTQVVGYTDLAPNELLLLDNWSPCSCHPADEDKAFLQTEGGAGKAS